MNIGLGDSKIFTTKAVKAASVQFKANTNFFIALSEFINCFLKHHMYFRNISEEEVEAEKQKKEQALKEKLLFEKVLKEKALKEKEMSESEEDESEEEQTLTPVRLNVAQMMVPSPTVAKNLKVEIPPYKPKQLVQATQPAKSVQIAQTIPLDQVKQQEPVIDNKEGRLTS